VTADKQPYGMAASAYHRRMSTSLSRFEVLMMLYQGVIRNLHAARIAYTEKDLERMCAVNEKNFRILGALQTLLDISTGGKKAEALNGFYKSMFVNLAKAYQSKNPEYEYYRLEHAMRDVYEHCKKSLPTPPLITTATQELTLLL